MERVSSVAARISGCWRQLLLLCIYLVAAIGAVASDLALRAARPVQSGLGGIELELHNPFDVGAVDTSSLVPFNVVIYGEALLVSRRKLPLTAVNSVAMGASFSRCRVAL